MVLTATLRCFGVFGFWVLQESKVLKFLGFMWNPLSWVMEAAAIMAIALANGGVSAAFYSFFFLCLVAEKSDWTRKENRT